MVEITNLIPNLDRDRRKIQKDIEQRKTQISTITEEIELISYGQNYRSRLLKP